MGPPDPPARWDIDLNADLGEGFGVWRLGDDEALLDVVTSANVACGFHAGDPSTMGRVCAMAAERGVRIGAHVAYRDLAGFGRRDLDVAADVLRDDVSYQVAALDGFARAAGTSVRYVKAHGALYNRAARDGEHAQALLDGVRAVAPGLPVLGLPGSVLLDLAERAGLPAVAEAFPDRGYTAEGALCPRAHRDALVLDAELVAERAVRMARDGEVVAVTGEVVVLHARTLCVHGDSPGAVARAERVRDTLRAAGATLEAFA